MAVLNFPADPTNGQEYDNFVFDATKNAWKLKIVSNLEDLVIGDISDVTITTPTDGQALVYDEASGNWINETPASTLESLTDTNISDPANGEALIYTGTVWENRFVEEPISPFLLSGM